MDITENIYKNDVSLIVKKYEETNHICVCLYQHSFSTRRYFILDLGY
jgi:hypothetical protein